jgi:hypothetical protein
LCRRRVRFAKYHQNGGGIDGECSFEPLFFSVERCCIGRVREGEARRLLAVAARTVAAEVSLGRRRDSGGRRGRRAQTEQPSRSWGTKQRLGAPRDSLLRWTAAATVCALLLAPAELSRMHWQWPRLAAKISRSRETRSLQVLFCFRLSVSLSPPPSRSYTRLLCRCFYPNDRLTPLLLSRTPWTTRGRRGLAGWPGTAQRPLSAEGFLSTALHHLNAWLVQF